MSWAVHLELVKHAGRVNVNDTTDPFTRLNEFPQCEWLAALCIADGLQFRRAKRNCVVREHAEVQMVLTTCPLHNYQRHDRVAIRTLCRRSCAIHARFNG